MSGLHLLGLGLVLGLRHALDTDHLAALGTIVYRERTLLGAARVGALWGLGHTTTVLTVGIAMLMFGLRLPPRWGLGLELCVAILLVGLGLLGLAGLREGRQKEEPRSASRAARSLGTGLVRGLAGSTAPALLVLGSVGSRWAGVGYLVVLCVGTWIGMAFVSVIFVSPLLRLSSRSHAWTARASRLAAMVSLGMGVFLFYRVGIVDGLFGPSPRWTPE